MPHTHTLDRSPGFSTGVADHEAQNTCSSSLAVCTGCGMCLSLVFSQLHNSCTVPRSSWPLHPHPTPTPGSVRLGQAWAESQASVAGAWSAPHTSTQWRLSGNFPEKGSPQMSLPS